MLSGYHERRHFCRITAATAVTRTLAMLAVSRALDHRLVPSRPRIVDAAVGGTIFSANMIVITVWAAPQSWRPRWNSLPSPLSCVPGRRGAADEQSTSHPFRICEQSLESLSLRSLPSTRPWGGSKVTGSTAIQLRLELNKLERQRAPTRQTFPLTRTNVATSSKTSMFAVTPRPFLYRLSHCTCGASWTSNLPRIRLALCHFFGNTHQGHFNRRRQAGPLQKSASSTLYDCNCL